MSTLDFTITFHTGFRVATGNARDGLDDTVNADDPLPASTLKGLMRAAARTLLPPDGTTDHPLVVAVFGDRHHPSPWNWSSADFADPPTRHPRAHVAIDPETGTAARDMLRFAEEHWATTATFDVLRTGPLPAEDADRHRMLLAAAGCAVHALGSDRRRGLGWVTVTCPDRPPTHADIDRLLNLRTAETPA
ncbi:RAMP superfamily CRISPR-associated protein [Mangrovihabitans endophyticus]|uniref:CRISPR type III-associated protein domain-containing protein n=1 Tax=Mangrovihabitans endophyticus TaxID=1751298 RepID=A0A8J3C1G5_9ACTN|nr:RAMP superfamily CRISPR-associated protein [Mangrovihabitans endophyticus]GGL05103.1 hypothetical protein GCM10012284_44570 [Mangrovihabitans endophyticus]